MTCCSMRDGGAENAGVEVSVRSEQTQGMKMQKWKYWHGPTRVEIAGVGTIMQGWKMQEKKYLE